MQGWASQIPAQPKDRKVSIRTINMPALPKADNRNRVSGVAMVVIEDENGGLETPELQAKSYATKSLTEALSKRQRKLEAYQQEHRRLSHERIPLEQEYKKALRKLQKHNKKLQDVGRAIFDLKHNGDTPHVTDHAIVRYLQRYKDINIEDLKIEIASHKNAHRQGSAIVTVDPETDTLVSDLELKDE